MTHSISGLFVVPSDLGALERKGVMSGVLDRAESGFLTKTITVHPFAAADRMVKLSENNIVYEFRQPEFTGLRAVSWMVFLLHMLKVTLNIRRIIRSERISFVRSQDPYFCGLIGWIASRYPRVSFCISVHSDYDKMFLLDPQHGAPTIFGRRGPIKKLERYLLSRADRVLVISNYIGACAVRNGANPDSVRLFRHIVKFQDFLDAGKTADEDLTFLPANQPIVSAVCRLSRQKYVYDIVELAEKLRATATNCVLVMAGSGEEENCLREKIAKAGLSEFVLMPGFLPQNVVAGLRSRSAVNLCLLDGQSLIEACATGRPVVAYDVEWHREILEDGVTGFIVPEGATDRLAKSVRYLLEHPEEADRMGGNARARIFDMFDPDRLRDARCSVYRELLDQAENRT